MLCTCYICYFQTPKERRGNKEQLLIGGLEQFLFSIYCWIIWNVSIPTDFHSIIFQRGGSTTNQKSVDLDRVLGCHGQLGRWLVTSKMAWCIVMALALLVAAFSSSVAIGCCSCFFPIVFHLFSYHCCYLPQLWSFSCASSCVFRGRHILCAGENIVNQNKRRLRATAATAGRSALIPSKDRKDLGWILDNWIFHNISFWWYNFHLIGIYQIKGGKSMCGLRNQWTSVCVWIGMYQYFGDPLAMSWVFVT